LQSDERADTRTAIEQPRAGALRTPRPRLQPTPVPPAGRHPLVPDDLASRRSSSRSVPAPDAPRTHRSRPHGGDAALLTPPWPPLARSQTLGWFLGARSVAHPPAALVRAQDLRRRVSPGA